MKQPLQTFLHHNCKNSEISSHRQQRRRFQYTTGSSSIRQSAGLWTTIIAVLGEWAEHTGLSTKRLGIFWSKCCKSADWDKDTHYLYHDVFSFTNRVRVKGNGLEGSNISKSLDACLLGEANQWYTEEISRITRTGLSSARCPGRQESSGIYLGRRSTWA
jgi:hypothetical protein